MFRRLLDLLNIASYPSAPRVRRECAFALNVHVDRDRFAEIRAAGFDTVLVDWVPSVYPPEFYADLLIRARAAGLKVFVTGFGKECLPSIPAAEELFMRLGSHIDYLAVVTEPDNVDHYNRSVEQFASDIKAVWAVKRTRSPHVKLVAPCLSSLGSSASKEWRDHDAVIRDLTRFGVLPMVDVIGMTAYKQTPDMVARYVGEQVKLFRARGWNQPVFVQEVGWESDDMRSEDRRATYIVNAMAKLSWLPGVSGVGLYALDDDVAAGETYGIVGKKSWGRVEKVIGGGE